MEYTDPESGKRYELVTRRDISGCGRCVFLMGEPDYPCLKPEGFRSCALGDGKEYIYQEVT